MIAMIIALSVLLMVLLLVACVEWKKSVREKQLDYVRPKKKKKEETWLTQFFSYKNKDTQMYLTMILGALASGSYFASRDGNFIVSAAVTAGLIAFVFKQREYSYEISYRKNGKKAIEFLAAVVSAGGTMEEWLEEVVPKLSGPLGRQFTQGYANYKFNNIPVSKFLKTLLESSPDSSLSLIWSGLIREANQGGDLQSYVVAALNDLSNQERMNRILGATRKSGAQLLAMTCILPVTLYYLFSDVLKTVLINHPSSNIVLLILLAGYFGIVWWGIRVTQPKRKRS